MKNIFVVTVLMLSVMSATWGARAGGRCSISDPQACGAGEYCRVKAPAQSGRGTCAKRPDMCMMIYKPVCGVDGKTYPNACHAAQAGVNVARDGACPGR